MRFESFDWDHSGPLLHIEIGSDHHATESFALSSISLRLHGACSNFMPRPKIKWSSWPNLLFYASLHAYLAADDCPREPHGGDLEDCDWWVCCFRVICHGKRSHILMIYAIYNSWHLAWKMINGVWCYVSRNCQQETLLRRRIYGNNYKCIHTKPY